MENQIQIQSKNTNLFLVIIFWIYTTIHLIIILYYSITDVDFRNINGTKFNILLVLSSLFISFLLTTIFVTLNFCRNIYLYRCLIPSVINELIFIFLLIFFLFIISNLPGKDPEIAIFLVIFLFLIESCPNIILFVHIYKKSKNKNSQNIDNLNNNSPLINNELS